MAEILGEVGGVLLPVRVACGRVVQVRAWGLGVAAANAGQLFAVLREFMRGLQGSDLDGVRGLAGLEQLLEVSLTADDRAVVTVADYPELIEAVVKVNRLAELSGKLLSLRLDFLETVEQAQAAGAEGLTL